MARKGEERELYLHETLEPGAGLESKTWWREWLGKLRKEALLPRRAGRGRVVDGSLEASWAASGAASGAAVKVSERQVYERLEVGAALVSEPWRLVGRL